MAAVATGTSDVRAAFKEYLAATRSVLCTNPAALRNLVSIVSTEATAFAKRASGGRKG